MEKQKRWQFILILTVMLLTLYNILPTIFYYTKPLRSPVDQAKAVEIAQQISERVNSLEEGSTEWIESFNKLIGIKAKSVVLREQDPRFIDIEFTNASEATRFKKLISRAGNLIPFAPSELGLFAGETLDPAKVTVMRKIAVNLDPQKEPNLFRYVTKYSADGSLSPEYKALVWDRATTIAQGLGGASPLALEMEALNTDALNASPDQEAMVIQIAEQIVAIDKTSSLMPSLTKRTWGNFAQGSSQGNALVLGLTSKLESAKTHLQTKVLEQKKEANTQLSEITSKNLANVEKALAVLKKNDALIKTSHHAMEPHQIEDGLKAGKVEGNQQILSLDGYNPFVKSLVIDYAEDKISFVFYDDINALRSEMSATDEARYSKDKLSQLLYNEIARVSRISDENITPDEEGFGINLTSLPDTQSLLLMDLGTVAEKQTKSLVDQLSQGWSPSHPDFAQDAYPVRTWNEFEKEAADSKKLGLVIFAPSMIKGEAPKGFRKGSIYVIARNLSLIMDKAKTSTNKALNDALSQDLRRLDSILTQNGFIGYAGNSYGLDKDFAKDFVFELDDYYSYLIRATREDFQVNGSKKVAVLPFTDVEQRIITRNKIDDSIQEDLLKWNDEYSASQVSRDPAVRYQVPAPSKSAFLSNLKLSAQKYFRGDDRKILKWGLDLSGGKTVRIGLKDRNGQPVTNPEDLKQAVNELYTRINKMGVSERTIRIENNNIVLEFPGSQGMSASDLVKASQMTFHIVNEKFSPYDPARRVVLNQYQQNQFLQEVWNEAVVTNRKTAEDINEIAWTHLGGTSFGQMETRPVSEAAKTLIENGLVIANPKDRNASGAFDDTLSMVAVLRGEDYTDWGGMTHPLLFVFNNWALEGSSLSNIQVGSDQNEGNHLSFSVKRSYEGQNAPEGSPRDDFYSWTSQFSEDKIAGTAKDLYANHSGWRMAVILNGTVISHPALRASLKESASISGGFTQREVDQLGADLKAGSLSFAPTILSEQNVSAELGTEERSKGIIASLVAIALVAFAMIGYYRFAGLVATIAVLINILIMWGVLQNLDAALTLPGIAGIVLTIGMAVDANVLVFERIREEFAISGRIATAIQTGYRKAFTAIFDSNITTIMAALILIQFDSGPIKGFAVTIIIGIFSSMFTALFMTRYFFAGWVKNPKNKSLEMSQWIHNTKFDFLGKAKPAIIISIIVMLLGAGLLFEQRKTLFGMDFTGGYSLNVELEPKPGVESYRHLALEALQKAGASNTEAEVRQLTLPNQLRISLSRAMDEKGHPFSSMPQEQSDGEFAYQYQKNPRIEWAVKALETQGLLVSDFQKQTLENNWSNVSGQLSDSMRNNALIGLSIALASILLYITFRFEFKYAVGAVVALMHDIVITLGFLALFNWMGFPVQIDMQIIGAIMTIIGYSLNDTIIVFDRIREDLKLYKKLSFYDSINHALNITLSRTLMTSGTTLLVLFTLVILGGQSIFGFALVMTIGVLIGTISSLFIAPTVMLWMHNRELKGVNLKKSLV